MIDVDTRQIRDVIHILTSQHQDDKRLFVAMRKYSDMCGFVLQLKFVF